MHPKPLKMEALLAEAGMSVSAGARLQHLLDMKTLLAEDGMPVSAGGFALDELRLSLLRQEAQVQAYKEGRDLNLKEIAEE